MTWVHDKAVLNEEYRDENNMAVPDVGLSGTQNCRIFFLKHSSHHMEIRLDMRKISLERKIIITIINKKKIE